MPQHTPLAGLQQRSARRRASASTQLEELRQKIHQFVIDELGPILYDQRVAEDELRRQVDEQLHAALAPGARRALRRRAQGSSIQDVTDDMLGYGPIDRLPQGRRHHRSHGERPGLGLRRAQRQARARPTSSSSTRRTSAASSTRS